MFTKACNQFEKVAKHLGLDERVEKLQVIEEKAKLMLACEESCKKHVFEEVDETKLEKKLDEMEAYLVRARVFKKKLEKLTLEQSFRPLKEGYIVLIGDDNKKKVLWTLGLVIEAQPGADGILRQVKLKTQQGELYRADQRLYHLEVSSKEDWSGTKTVNSDIPSVPFETLKEEIPCVPLETVIKVPVTTRSGRTVKVLNKLSL
ncbi:hypothetical protein JTE90_011615 [Oedothorax gibbosus]|uniref:DUF5641 domain-containing protein n=1 Tax=Oedothorax gibbosus TaxID=931172 RepID=A0AAV6U4F2_9ARAC|nr:hypothetical protein JTE90_011615 [Oedothorax gibbosus]